MHRAESRQKISIGLGILSQLFQNRLAELLAPWELTYSQLALLSHLARHDEPASVSELANALEINQPGTTKVVKRLEEAGLVSVASAEGDRRRKLVQISAQGGAVLERAAAAIGADNTAWFAGWSDDELAEFGDQVHRLVSWLDDNRLR